MKNKKVTLLCSSFRFTSIEFNKPPFLIMKNITKIYNYKTSIVFDSVLNKIFYKDDTLVSMDNHQGVDLINLTKNKNISSKKTINLYKLYLLEHAKEIDLLIVFHGNLTEIKLCNYYKKLNPNGKVMIILDFSIEEYVKQQAKLKIKLKNILKTTILKKTYINFYNNCDVFSVQIKKSLEFLSKNKWNGLNIKNKLEFLPFGYDKENLLIDN